MSGLFGGGSQTVTSSNEPFAPIRPFIRSTARDIGRLADQNRLDPFVAPSTATSQFIGGLANLGRDNPFTDQTMGNYSGFMDANTSVGGPRLRGDLGQVNLSGDQFGMDALTNSVLSRVIPSVAGTFGQGGFANSTMAQQTAADAATNALAPFLQQQFNLDRGRMDENTYYNAAQSERMLGRSDANAWARTALQGQNIDRGLSRDLSGLGLAPTISGMQYADLQALGQAGGMRDAINQDRAGTASSNAQMAANLFGSLGGLGGVQTQTSPGASPLQTLGGIGQLGVNAGIAGSLLGGLGGASAAGAAGAFAPAAMPIGLSALGMLPLCDRRLKSDIEPTGATYRGAALYTFRYLWDEPGVRRIGPMAQEVPPHARVTLPSGFLAVDMGAL